MLQKKRKKKKMSRNETTMNTKTFSANDRKFWSEFLALYQSQRALWDKEDEKYKDRSAKVKCHNLLREKLREIVPAATHADVLRRINIFRTNYRRERVRALKNRQRGGNYQTSLWYFNLLSFLEPQMLIKTEAPHKTFTTNSKVQSKMKAEIKASPASNYKAMDVIVEDLDYFFKDDDRMNDDDMCVDEMLNKDECNETHEVDSTTQYKYSKYIEFEPQSTMQAATAVDEYVVTDEQGNNVVNVATTDTALNSETAVYKVFPKEIQQKQKSKVPVQDVRMLELYNTESDTLENQKEPPNDNHLSVASDILARSWAVQYDEMTTEQKIYARKEIAEILFAGCMGTLGLKDC